MTVFSSEWMDRCVVAFESVLLIPAIIVICFHAKGEEPSPDSVFRRQLRKSFNYLVNLIGLTPEMEKNEAYDVNQMQSPHKMQYHISQIIGSVEQMVGDSEIRMSQQLTQMEEKLLKYVKK